MKNVSHNAVVIAALAFTVLLAGCGPKDEESATPNTTAPGSATPAVTTDAGTGATKTVAVVTAQPKGSLKVGGSAVCAVCAVKEGTKETEEVKAVLDYKGKTYGFCDETEKAEFISSPTKYAQTP